MASKTDAQNVTYRVDDSRPGCKVAEMTHYDQPGTGFLWCSEHGHVVGAVR